MCVVEPIEHSKMNLKEAEVITREINNALMKCSKDTTFGNKLSLPNCGQELIYTKYRTPAELNRLRFQFLNLVKARDGVESAGESYVNFLNSLA